MPAAKGEPHVTAQHTPVDIFAPWAGREERTLRVRLYRARDIAQARAARTNDARAWAIWNSAAQLAGDWVFFRTSPAALRETLHTLSELFIAAGAIEQQAKRRG